MNIKEIGKSIIWFLILAVILVGLRHFVFTPVVVKGDSMDPTLIDGERVIALKNTDIKRFDIVTFPAPDDEGKTISNVLLDYQAILLNIRMMNFTSTEKNMTSHIWMSSKAN